jgi:hypothetical protein
MPVQLRAFELKSLITKDLLEYRRSFQQKPGICSWPSPRFCEEKLFEARFPPRTKTAKKRTQIVWAPIIPTRQDSESGPPLCLVRDSRILRPAGGGGGDQPHNPDCVFGTALINRVPFAPHKKCSPLKWGALRFGAGCLVRAARPRPLKKLEPSLEYPAEKSPFCRQDQTRPGGLHIGGAESG